jgi:putative hemolysin
MIAFSKGSYDVRQAAGPAEVERAQVLRATCFGLSNPRDYDAFDDRCIHFLIEDRATGTLVCCFRLLALKACELPQSYAAQFYELSALEGYDGLMMELGRFCVHPDWRDPDIVRLAWAAMTDFVDSNGVQMLFGCSSFAGADRAAHLDAFAMLKARHLAPTRWLPRVKAPDVFRFAARLRRKPDVKKAILAMPPLLRTYLMMGGWVSDHAVVDLQMNTMHVFTALEIGAIPDSRKRLLRALV